MPQAIATQHHRRYVRINCARVRDPEEWFGYREAENGATKFVATEFTEALERGNAVIVLDEFNRVEPWLHNTLYPLLDDSRKTIIHNREVTVGPKVVFCATVNLGYTFTGTFTLDAALVNRMDLTVLVQELPEQVEIELLIKRFKIKDRDSRLIVKSIAGLRKVAAEKEIEADLSTRTSLKIARLVKARMSLKLALQYTLLNLLNQDEKKASVDTVNTILSKEGARIRLDDEQKGDSNG